MKRLYFALAGLFVLGLLYTTKNQSVDVGLKKDNHEITSPKTFNERKARIKDKASKNKERDQIALNLEVISNSNRSEEERLSAWEGLDSHLPNSKKELIEFAQSSFELFKKGAAGKLELNLRLMALQSLERELHSGAVSYGEMTAISQRAWHPVVRSVSKKMSDFQRNEGVSYTEAAMQALIALEVPE